MFEFKRILKEELYSSIRIILMVLVFALIGYLLLIVAYLLPVDAMMKNVGESAELLKSEKIQYKIVEKYPETTIDNYTEGLTFNSAICDGGTTVLEKAAAIHQYRYSDQEIYYYSLLRYFDGDDTYYIDEYARDWHGYLVYIKPLLLFLNYKGIRALNLLFQLICIVTIITMMIRKRIGEYIPAFIILLISIAAPVIFMSMEYSALFNLILISIIYIIFKGESLVEPRLLRTFFVIVGAVLAYVDVLTYPVLTLGAPMIFIYVLYEKYECKKDAFIYFVRCCWYWIIGYGGMWGMKWVIASIFTEKNVIKEAILMVLYRMSSSSNESGEQMTISLVDVLSRNLGIYFKTPYIVMAILSIMWIVWCIYRKKYQCKSYDVFMILITCLVPMAWYILIKNHSYIHYWMTYRNLGVVTFALSCFEAKCRKNRKTRKEI